MQAMSPTSLDSQTAYACIRSIYGTQTGFQPVRKKRSVRIQIVLDSLSFPSNPTVSRMYTGADSAVCNKCHLEEREGGESVGNYSDRVPHGQKQPSPDRSGKNNSVRNKLGKSKLFSFPFSPIRLFRAWVSLASTLLRLDYLT
jgi:hypothetical protein